MPDLGVVKIVNVSKPTREVNIITPDGEEMTIPLSRFVVSDTIPTISVVPMFVYISHEDYSYLQNPPSSFVWKLKTLNIDISKFTEGEELEYESQEVKYVDTYLLSHQDN